MLSSGSKPATVAGRIIYLPYLIASSPYGKCYGYRMIRITLPAAYLYCRNHFRIRPIFIIISRDFRFFWRHIPEPYNTKTQGTLYFTVGTDSRCRTSPGRISKIRCFQKHGKPAGSEMPLLEGQHEAHHLTSHHRALPLWL